MGAKQLAKFYELRKFATLQDLCIGPFFFSLWLKFPSDFSHDLRARLGFFVLGLTQKFWPNLARKSTKISIKCG